MLRKSKLAFQNSATSDLVQSTVSEDELVFGHVSVASRFYSAVEGRYRTVMDVTSG